MNATHKIINPKVARELADYHSAMAEELKRHADTLERRSDFQTQSLMDLFRSGKLAAAFIFNGMDETMAIRTAADRLSLPYESVATHLRRFQAERDAATREKLRDLRKRGLSLRQIAKETGRPKSTIADMLKRKWRPESRHS